MGAGAGFGDSPPDFGFTALASVEMSSTSVVISWATLAASSLEFERLDNALFLKPRTIETYKILVASGPFSFLVLRSATSWWMSLAIVVPSCTIVAISFLQMNIVNS